MKRFLSIVALLLLGAMATPSFASDAGSKIKEGLIVKTTAAKGNAALIIQNTSGTATLTVGASGAITATGAVSTGAITPASIVGVGVVTAGNITDVVRNIQLPISVWRTDADPPLEIAAGTTPNISAEGNFDTIEWATGENTQKVTTSFKVPDDFVSGMELHILHAHDGATDDDETMELLWYCTAVGGADNPTVIDEAAQAITYAVTISEEVIALDGGTPAAGQLCRLVVGFTAIDETVHILDLSLEYTATQ